MGLLQTSACPSASAGFITRAASAGDLDLTCRNTGDAMRPYVEATWGAWNEDEQLAKHALNYQPQTHRIITVDAEGGSARIRGARRSPLVGQGPSLRGLAKSGHRAKPDLPGPRPSQGTGQAGAPACLARQQPSAQTLRVAGFPGGFGDARAVRHGGLPACGLTLRSSGRATACVVRSSFHSGPAAARCRAPVSFTLDRGAHPSSTLRAMAPTIVREGQYRLFFFSREETRIHVHVSHP